MKSISLFILSSLVLACQNAPVNQKTKSSDRAEESKPVDVKTSAKPKSESTVEQYSKILDKLLNTLAGANDPKMVDTQARQLFGLSQQILRDLIKARAECGQYLQALLAVDSTLLSLTPELIESGYHRDGRLPKNNSPLCHHAKDLMVHPATVVILNAQSPRVDRVLMQKEVIELKGHLHEIQNASAVKSD